MTGLLIGLACHVAASQDALNKRPVCACRVLGFKRQFLLHNLISPGCFVKMENAFMVSTFCKTAKSKKGLQVPTLKYMLLLLLLLLFVTIY